MIKEESIRGAGRPLPPSLPKPGGGGQASRNHHHLHLPFRHPKSLPQGFLFPSFPHEGQGRTMLVSSWAPSCPFPISTFPVSFPALSTGTAVPSAVVPAVLQVSWSCPLTACDCKDTFYPLPEAHISCSLRVGGSPEKILDIPPILRSCLLSSTNFSAITWELAQDICSLGPSAPTVPPRSSCCRWVRWPCTYVGSKTTLPTPFTASHRSL